MNTNEHEYNKDRARLDIRNQVDYPPIESSICISYQLRVQFTRNAFSPDNLMLRDTVCPQPNRAPATVAVYVDDNIPSVCKTEIERYFNSHSNSLQLAILRPLPGGEIIKNSTAYVEQIYADVESQRICRHSFIIAIGGGAVLDVVGYAAATAHRGVRHIRFPTTALAQADAGVGVKNGINWQARKNFIGTFAPPYAIINDLSLLRSLPQHELRNGFSEAVKVALIKDDAFFAWLEANADALNAYQWPAIEYLIYRCAQLHAEHIATSGDPFETGSARPLDFGHWAAHKLEQLSEFRLAHGEAVAVGMALDIVYARSMGLLADGPAQRTLKLMRELNLPIYTEDLIRVDVRGRHRILEGLEEFRQHLGGTLTVTMVRDIGQMFEVHEMDEVKIVQAIDVLRQTTRIED